MFCCNLQYFQITIFSIQIYLLQITQTISLSQIALPHHPSHKRRHQRAPPKLFPQIWSLIFLEHSYFLFPHIFLDWAFAWVHRNGVFKSSAFPNYNTCLALMGFDVNNKPIKTEWVAFSRISSKIEFYIREAAKKKRFFGDIAWLDPLMRTLHGKSISEWRIAFLPSWKSD